MHDYAIYGLNDQQLSSFVEAYETGANDFFHNGENFYLDEDIKKIIVFDLSKVGREIGPETINVIKITIRKNLGLGFNSFEGISSEYGVDVTAKYIQKKYGHKNATPNINAIPKYEEYVDLSRISELINCPKKQFDLTKLIRLCEELNIANEQRLFFAVGTLVRALLDHIPPIFDQSNFSGVANNYKAKGKDQSFKASMDHLDKSMRKIVDTILHSHITKSETLPNATQIDCKRDLDRLLEEVVRILKDS